MAFAGAILCFSLTAITSIYISTTYSAVLGLFVLLLIAAGMAAAAVAAALADEGLSNGGFAK